MVQLLDADERAQMLAGIARCLAAGGPLRRWPWWTSPPWSIARAFEAEPRPDMRELDGWVYSSEPLWVQLSDDVLRMRRLRERVSPGGDLVRKVHDDVLLPPHARGARAGGRARGPARRRDRRTVPANEFEAGSVVVVLEAP